MGSATVGVVAPMMRLETLQPARDGMYKGWQIRRQSLMSAEQGQRQLRYGIFLGNELHVVSCRDSGATGDGQEENVFGFGM